MIQFDQITALNDELVASLIALKNHEGFYGSTPLSPNSSFTTTGLVLQALNEARATSEAQILADQLLKRLREKYEEEKIVGFPNEAGGPPHVMCNAGVIFAILECYPVLVKEELFDAVCEWFISSQHEDGYWNLYQDTHSESLPVWTGFAANTLIQFYDCYQKFNKPTDRIESCIRKAVSFLKDNRPDIAKTMNLLLWSQSGNPDDVRVSFAMSAMCLHVFLRYSTRFNDAQLGQQVSDTCKSVFERFEKDGTFHFKDYKVDMWGSIHDHSKRTYVWSFFMPINIVTVLKLLPDAAFKKNEKYYSFIKYAVDWILENKIIQSKKLGIRGGQEYSNLAIWSTAQASTVLSRILGAARKLQELENDVMVGMRKTQKELLDEYLSAIRKNLDDEDENRAIKYARRVIIASGTIFCILFLIISTTLIVPAWATVEPWVWVGSIVLPIIVPTILYKKIEATLKNRLKSAMNRRTEQIIDQLRAAIKN